MTTIAWDGKTVAYDSRSVAGGIIATERAEKGFRNGRRFAVGAGHAAFVRAFCRWLIGLDDEPEELPEDGFCVFYFDGESAWEYTNTKLPLPLAEKESAGSGSELALAAMHLGKTAREAVKVASKLDTGTGGRIRTFKPTITAEAL